MVALIDLMFVFTLHSPPTIFNCFLNFTTEFERVPPRWRYANAGVSVAVLRGTFTDYRRRNCEVSGNEGRKVGRKAPSLNQMIFSRARKDYESVPVAPICAFICSAVKCRG